MLKKWLHALKSNVLAIIIIITLFYIALVIFSDANKMVGYLVGLKVTDVVIILLFFSASIIIRSIRQLVLLKQIDIKMPYKQNLIIYCAGLLMTITPGSMGQMIKSGYIYRLSHEPIAKTLPLVIAERYHDILSLTCFIVAIVISMSIPVLIVPISVIIVGLTTLTVLLKMRGVLSSLTSLLSKVKIFRISTEDRAEFNASIATLFRKENLLIPWLLSMIVSIFDALGIYACFVALNLNLNIGLTTAFGFTSVLFGAASFIPGGVGITEISFIKFLSDNGITLAAASAVVILMRLCSVWYSTFIGAISTYFASRLKYTADLRSKNV